MTLAEYIKEKRTSASAIAEQAQCAVSTITRILSGERAPSLELALHIERITGGQVRPESFIPTPSHEGAAS